MKSTILTYRTIIQKDGQYYHGFVPSLPGCHTQGDTIEAAQKNLREAITGYLKVLHQVKQPIPTETGIEAIETFEVQKLFPGKNNIVYA